MKYRVTRFRSLELCLKELEPFIRDGEHLQTGRPLARFGGLRSRELLANWLLSVAVNFDRGAPEMSFTSDPVGGDGIIHDTVTGETWPTEHVLVPRAHPNEMQPIEAKIVRSIQRKQSKGGRAYASGKLLMVFLNAGGGIWTPNVVARQLPQPLNFREVWVSGLYTLKDGIYTYGVTRLDLSQGNAPTWLVRIARDFDGWEVTRLQ